MDGFVRLTKKEYSTPVHLLAMAVGGLLFVILMPKVLTQSARRLDQRRHLRPFGSPAWRWPLGALLIATGFPLAFWTVIDQARRASGTPIPVVATQTLLTDGPYSVCRNPMVLGTIMTYSGLAIGVGSFSALEFVALFAGGLMLYLKYFEEIELQARFGPAYDAYQQNTPFLRPDLNAVFAAIRKIRF